MRGLLLLLPLVLAGCISVGWSRDRRHEPLPEGAIETLEPGRSTLAECLERLGAPLYVWEYKGDGAALVWGWNDEDRKGISVSVPVYEQASASLSYDDARERLRGAVLLFGGDLVLEQVRMGWLRDLESELLRRRPAPVHPAE
ncbi:MAG: hypothetical protein ACKVXR_09595 [Planctomycetota bacterium]